MGEEFVSDDEFHETFEDITSTSGSESADEASSPDNRKRINSTKGAANVEGSPPVWTPTSFQSKFSVWKDDPSSINERRQRFFKQMGLKSLRDELLDSHFDTSLSGGLASNIETGTRNLSEVVSASRSDEYVSVNLYLLQYVPVRSYIASR